MSVKRIINETQRHLLKENLELKDRNEVLTSLIKLLIKYNIIPKEELEELL